MQEQSPEAGRARRSIGAPCVVQCSGMEGKVALGADIPQRGTRHCQRRAAMAVPYADWPPTLRFASHAARDSRITCAAAGLAA
jgi:hypothetical protein